MRFRKLLLILFLSIFGPQIWAEKAPSTKDLIFELKKDNRTDRPRMPSRQSVYGAYDGENLYIEFSIPEGMCDMVVSDSDGFEQTYQFDSNSPSVTYIGEVETAVITITTSCGNAYEGSIGDW